jgi:2-oxoglutarate/2-oxoacid ferredoxin oxidoreductase subunit beta
MPMMEQAVLHRGFSLVDVLQPCPTFNKVDSRESYKDKLYHLEDEQWPPTDKNKALIKAGEWGSRIPLGIFYREKRSTYEEQLPQLKNKTLLDQGASAADIKQFLKGLS